MHLTGPCSVCEVWCARLRHLISLTRSSGKTSQRSPTGMSHGSSPTPSFRPMVNSTNTGLVATRVRWNQHNIMHAIRPSTETLLPQTPTELINSSSATPSCRPMINGTNTGSVATKVRWNYHKEYQHKSAMA